MSPTYKAQFDIVPLPEPQPIVGRIQRAQKYINLANKAMDHKLPAGEVAALHRRVIAEHRKLRLRGVYVRGKPKGQPRGHGNFTADLRTFFAEGRAARLARNRARKGKNPKIKAPWYVGTPRDRWAADRAVDALAAP